MRFEMNWPVSQTPLPLRAPSAICLGAGAAALWPGVAMAHGVPQGQVDALLHGGNLAYMWSGALHMLTGYDHLLFLFGVVFFLTRAADVVKFVTAFTIGHSATLLFATLAGIRANYYLIDAVIALSVIYKGFDNTDGFRRKLSVAPPNLLLMVFLFGLIHGFGLSTRLQQLPLPEEGLVLRILSFNLGVELGQLAALLAMVALLAGWRRRASFGTFSIAANNGLMIAGALLFLMQMHGYLHVAFPDEFGHEAHHAHESAPPPTEERESIFRPKR
jgi:hypothetical protein